MTLQSSACTMVMASKNGFVFAGNNEDWKNPMTIAKFIPASADEFGRVCFGFDDGYAQGGMNDQGLFIDANAISPTDYKPSPEKENYNGPMIDYILASCATIDDAIVFFEKYNTPGLRRQDFPSLINPALPWLWNGRKEKFNLSNRTPGIKFPPIS